MFQAVNYIMRFINFEFIRYHIMIMLLWLMIEFSRTRNDLQDDFICRPMWLVFYIFKRIDLVRLLLRVSLTNFGFA